MGNNPKASSDETGPEGIQRPERKFCCTIKDWVRELDDFRMDTGIEESGSLVDSSQGGKIRDAEGVYASELTCHDTKGKETDTYSEDRHPFLLKQCALKREVSEEWIGG